MGYELIISNNNAAYSISNETDGGYGVLSTDPWILADGTWRDVGLWIDDALWNDG